MKFNTWMMISAALGVIFGLGYLFLPATLLGIYGMTVNPGSVLAARFFGGSVLGWGVLAWFAREARESVARDAITLSLFIMFSIALVLSIVGVTSGVFNVFGWVSAGIFLILGGVFAYFRFIKS